MHPHSQTVLAKTCDTQRFCQCVRWQFGRREVGEADDFAPYFVAYSVVMHLNVFGASRLRSGVCYCNSRRIVHSERGEAELRWKYLAEQGA